MSKVVEWYKNHYVVRYNEDHTLKYFRQDSFPGLQSTDISFTSGTGETIRGRFYFYENYDDSKLVVFSSGIGPGHIAYMTEINRICREGYRVLAYDNVGCGLSTGKNIRGMSESLANLDAVLNQLKSDREVLLIGHSWGGYAVSNIYAYHPEIKKIVVISAFLSIYDMCLQNAPGLKRLLIPLVTSFEKSVNPKYALSSAVNVLKKADAKVLWLQSEDDQIVNYNFAMKKAMKKLKNNSNITFISCTGKMHTPQYSTDAAQYLYSVFDDFGKKCRAGILRTFEEKKSFMEKTDWDRMVKQDDSVWEKIFDFYKG